MEMVRPIPFIPESGPARPGPLARFLPSVPEGILSTWLKENLSEPGTCVLDPFGASPLAAIEAARAGYRVVVAANNPVARFLLEMAAQPAEEMMLRAALAELAATFKGAERIEPHIRSLYETQCAQCQEKIMAEAFLWEKGASAPFTRIYHCPYCGDGGERPVDEQDIARANQLAASGGLHRARAIERVAPRNDLDRPHAEEALATYLPRAIYALINLVNKLETTSPARRQALIALLLSACDQANTLWPYPTVRARPRQLSIPPRFKEYNVWLALEEAIHTWSSAATTGKPVPLYTWPELPPPGGISVFEGKLRDLADELQRVTIGAVLAVYPRPNQAYWTLSALWAGWLWGREAAAPFKSVLRRRRYDWAWHSNALHAALVSLGPCLAAGTPMFGLLTEAEPGLLTAAVVSARMAGYQLEGIGLRTELDLAQLTWRKPESSAVESGSLLDTARQAALECLVDRAEPGHYLSIHAAALAAIEPLLPLAAHQDPDPSPAETLTQVQTMFGNVFTFRSGFLRFGGSEHSLEAGSWWLRSEGIPCGPKDHSGLPLADRVEKETVRILQSQPGKSEVEIDRAICAVFPGLLTPERSLVEACLESYSEPGPGAGRVLRANDRPKIRREELAQAASALRMAASRLGYRIEAEDPAGSSPVQWVDSEGEIHYCFYLSVSAVIGRTLLNPVSAPTKPVLIYTSDRANLLLYKLDNNPCLKRIVQSGWRFLQFSQLHRLAENDRLNRFIFEESLDALPTASQDPQMTLL